MFISLVTVGNSEKSEQHIVGVFSTISLAQHHTQLRMLKEIKELFGDTCGFDCDSLPDFKNHCCFLSLNVDTCVTGFTMPTELDKVLI